MRKLFALVGLGFLLTACPNKPDGNLTGVLDRPVYVPEVPIGMAYVPTGGFQQGENDGDVPFLHQTRARSVSVQAFYIDETEISNNEYRQFVHWVRDSIAKELLVANLYRAADPSLFESQSLQNEETWSQPGQASSSTIWANLIGLHIIVRTGYGATNGCVLLRAATCKATPMVSKVNGASVPLGFLPVWPTCRIVVSIDSNFQ
jgi:hypothetical protein